jgi:hypothetical protein
MQSDYPRPQFVASQKLRRLSKDDSEIFPNRLTVVFSFGYQSGFEWRACAPAPQVGGRLK